MTTTPSPDAPGNTPTAPEEPEAVTASADPTGQPGTDAPPRKTRGVLLVMCGSVMSVQSLVAAINLAIPKLSASSLHPSPTQLLWIVDSYVIVFAALLVPAGALGDRLGRKGTLVSGLGLFAVSAVVSALAPDVAVLLTGRALGGAGAALLMPASMSLLLHGVPASRRAAAVAIWGASQAVGGVLGNSGGALILQYLPWRALFWVYVPIAAVLVALAAYLAPRPARVPTALDAPGSALLVTGCVALLFGIIEGPSRGWSSPAVLAAFGTAVVVLTGPRALLVLWLGPDQARQKLQLPQLDVEWAEFTLDVRLQPVGQPTQPVGERLGLQHIRTVLIGDHVDHFHVDHREALVLPLIGGPAQDQADDRARADDRAEDAES